MFSPEPMLVQLKTMHMVVEYVTKQEFLARPAQKWTISVIDVVQTIRTLALSPTIGDSHQVINYVATGSSIKQAVSA